MTAPIVAQSKVCIKCDTRKSLDEFQNVKASKDGKKNSCRECAIAYHKQYYASHKDKMLADMKEYREVNKDQLAAKRVEYHKEYYQLNKESVDAKNREWAAANSDRWAEYIKDYYNDHKEEYAARSRKRRALKHNQAENFTYEEFEELKAIFGRRCLSCGISEQDLNDAGLSMTADHVVPLSRGGSDAIDNIQPLCGHCNNVKFTKTIDYRRSAILTGSMS